MNNNSILIYLLNSMICTETANTEQKWFPRSWWMRPLLIFLTILFVV